MHRPFSFFIGATGQHIGKTTISLGLMSGLKKRYKNVGFFKPIGQEYVEIDGGIHVDKDVVLFKDHFQLNATEELMNPVLFKKGFTKNIIDGVIDNNGLKRNLDTAYSALQKTHDAILVEGTGHVGVGSIANLNNAQVAHQLGLKMILILPGGIGSAFDAFAINRALCTIHHAQIAGVIVNRIYPKKHQETVVYLEKALKQYKIPLLGAIPFNPLLSYPTMQDFTFLFNTTLIAGHEHQVNHFKNIRLAATSLKNYTQYLSSHQLTITPANREDIILATLTYAWSSKLEQNANAAHMGLLLTGIVPPRESIIHALKKAKIPTLYAKMGSYEAMEKITSYTVKIRKGDQKKIQQAIAISEKNIDFEQLIERIKS